RKRNGWPNHPLASAVPRREHSLGVVTRRRLERRRPPVRAPIPNRGKEASMTRKNGGSGPRAVALVGPFGSGKTTLLESILSIAGAIQRKGSVAQGNTVGDGSAEARARQMSVEVNCATTKYLEESITFLDCPGSIEFLQD